MLNDYKVVIYNYETDDFLSIYITYLLSSVVSG